MRQEMTVLRVIFSAIVGVLFTFTPLVAFAQEPSGLSADLASKFHAYVPSGWKLVLVAQGDLNKDNKSDAVLLVQDTKPEKVQKNDGYGGPILNTNERRLIVLLARKKGFKELLSTNKSIPLEDDVNAPCLVDPLLEGEMSIKKGILLLRFNYWYSCGSNGVTNTAYKFRYGKGKMRLIGLDYFSFYRNQGDIYETSTNYLTGMQKTTTGEHMFDETQSNPKSKWKKVKTPTIYLGDKLPGTFE